MTETSTKAFWIVAPGAGEIRHESMAPPKPGEVQVRTLFSGISRGTESLIFRGEVPASEFERMRAPFQVGDFSFPLKYGYCSVGIIEAGDPAWIGRRVFCLHPHQQRYVVPATAVVELPDELPSGRAVLAANMETAINAVWDGNPGPGDRIAVVGGGVVGALVAWLCAGIPGTTVELIDTNPDRAELARTLGCRFHSPAPANVDCDLVFHASGQTAGLCTALQLAGQEASVIELSWYGARPVTLPLGEGFHARRLTLKSSQVGNLPPARLPRWNYHRRLTLALSLLADPRLDALISGESAFDDLPQALAQLSTDPAGALCHRIRYPEI
jgi:2-desacetyl-2-hydroxyethyl bacteriochlorophyllide A dehydrogenase